MCLSTSTIPYPLRHADEGPHSTNWDRIHQFYDLDSPRPDRVPVRHLINWIIHSFVFLHEVRSDLAGGAVLEAFYVNSDRTRKKDLLRVGWANYRVLIDEIVRDDVVAIRTYRSPNGDEVQLRSRTPFTAQDMLEFERRHDSFIREAIAEAERRRSE
jgi:hypothetical protein